MTTKDDRGDFAKRCLGGCDIGVTHAPPCRRRGISLEPKKTTKRGERAARPMRDRFTARLGAALRYESASHQMARAYRTMHRTQEVPAGLAARLPPEKTFRIGPEHPWPWWAEHAPDGDCPYCGGQCDLENDCGTHPEGCQFGGSGAGFWLIAEGCPLFHGENLACP